MASSLVETSASKATEMPNGTSASSAATAQKSMNASDSPTINISKTLFDLSDKWNNAACVFCGSSDGNKPVYKQAADQLGKAMAEQGVPLVYGGGTNGLMGAIAHATYSYGGSVFGIIPRALMDYERKPGEVGSRDGLDSAIKKPDLLTEAKEDSRSVFWPVKTMHQRKQEMAVCSSLGFIALPGGYGTFEEVLEMVTWTQLRIHAKPVVLLNIGGFWSPLRDLIRTAVASGFIRPDNEDLLVFVDGPESEQEANAFDWGTAALKAAQKWHKEKRGDPYQLKWDMNDS